MLIHRCTCGHPDIYHHRGLLCSHGTCSERCGQFDLADPDPELIPTFVWRNGRTEQNEVILAPGSKFGPPSQPNVLCNCDRCQQRFAELSVAA